jgi:hypothetical protein
MNTHTLPQSILDLEVQTAAHEAVVYNNLNQTAKSFYLTFFNLLKNMAY